MEREGFICKRLKELGYARERRMRLYGEELQITSNPARDAIGFGVEGMAVRTGTLKHIQIPLSVLDLLERELAECEVSAEQLELAA